MPHFCRRQDNTDYDTYEHIVLECLRACSDALISVAIVQCVVVLFCVATHLCNAVYCSMLQCVAVCGSVLQCVAVCCRVLQCDAVCCSVLQ